MKRTIGAAAVLAVAALVLTGCSASSGPSAGSDEVAVLETSVPLGLAPEQVCGLAQELAVEALGTSGLEEIPSGNGDYAECVASSDEELVRIAVSGTSAGIEEQQNLHEALLDGSDDSLQQCPDGAEAAGVVTGLEGETSMICNGGGTSMFEYVGGAPGGVLLVRVERSTEGGNAISREQAQTWVDFAMTGLHDAAVSASESSDGSSSPATSLAISQVVMREDGLNFTVNISLSFGAPVEDVTVAAPGQTTAVFPGEELYGALDNSGDRDVPIEGESLAIQLVYAADSPVCARFPMLTFDSGACGITVAMMDFGETGPTGRPIAASIPAAGQLPAAASRYLDTVAGAGASGIRVGSIPDDGGWDSYVDSIAHPIGMVAVSSTPPPRNGLPELCGVDGAMGSRDGIVAATDAGLVCG